MDSKTAPPVPVNPPSAYFRQGQSVLVVDTGQIGVVTLCEAGSAGPQYSVAVWPRAQLRRSGGLLAHLTTAHACGVASDTKCVCGHDVARHPDRADCLRCGCEVFAGETMPCRPRPRDGRCFSCERVIEGVEVTT